jgi:hypothetical protein
LQHIEELSIGLTEDFRVKVLPFLLELGQMLLAGQGGGSKIFINWNASSPRLDLHHLPQPVFKDSRGQDVFSYPERVVPLSGRLAEKVFSVMLERLDPPSKPAPD